MGEYTIKLNKKALMFIIAFAFVLAIAGTSAAAVNETENVTTSNVTDECVGSDPIINGTITVNEYGHTRPLEGATVIVNSNSGKALASTTTDANGYYSVNFYSAETTFNIIASYVGCTPITQSITVANGPNYPTDPNKYGTLNFNLTPKTATLTSTGNGRTVYIQGQNKDGFAGVINVRVDGTTYVAYCIDLFTPISTGDTLLVNGPLPGTAGDLPSEVEWDKVSYILNHYSPSSNTEAAAIQCAIWYFTSVHYGTYNPSAPVGTYYQYMTATRDGVIRNWYGDDTTVRTRAWNIINQVNAATIPPYPNSLTLTPETTTVANGQTVTVTATVKDVNGNPVQGVTVNFQTTSGSITATGTTDANGQVSRTLTLTDNQNAVVTAYVSGNYGNLLYDDQYATVRKQNLVARNVFPLTISDISIVNTAATANVALSQTATSPVNVGDTVTYTVTATNNGPSTATGIVISDAVPAGLSGVTVTPSVGTYYNGVWTIPTLANGANATLTITGTATASMAGLNTTNTATRTAQEQYNGMSATTTTDVYTKLSDPIITQTVNGKNTGSLTLNVGEAVSFIINAYCSGPDDATNIQIQDIVPAGLENVTVTPSVGTYDYNTGIWSIAFLERFTSATLTIAGQAGAMMLETIITNNAVEIYQTEYNPNPGNSTSIPIYTTNVDITLETYAYSKYNAWHYNVEIPFITSVKNNASNTANNIVVEIKIPLNQTLISVNLRNGDSYEYNENTRILTWIVGSLPGKQIATFEYTLLNKNIGTIDINSTAKTGNLTKTSNWTINTPNAADVEITQQASNYNPTNGEIITITVTAKNNGPSNASGYKIQNTIPSGLTLISATPSKGTYSNGIWNLGTLSYIDGVGETATLTLQVQYNSPTANNAHRYSSTTYDWIPTNSGSTQYP